MRRGEGGEEEGGEEEGGGGGGGGLNSFKFSTFTGRFPSEGAATMAVKGLM